MIQDGKKNFTLFRWLPMKEEVKKALVDDEDEHTVELVIDEIIYEDRIIK